MIPELFDQVYKGEYVSNILRVMGVDVPSYKINRLFKGLDASITLEDAQAITGVISALSLITDRPNLPFGEELFVEINRRLCSFSSDSMKWREVELKNIGGNKVGATNYTTLGKLYQVDSYVDRDDFERMMAVFIIRQTETMPFNRYNMVSAIIGATYLLLRDYGKYVDITKYDYQYIKESLEAGDGGCAAKDILDNCIRSINK